MAMLVTCRPRSHFPADPKTMYPQSSDRSRHRVNHTTYMVHPCCCFRHSEHGLNGVKHVHHVQHGEDLRHGWNNLEHDGTGPACGAASLTYATCRCRSCAALQRDGQLESQSTPGARSPTFDLLHQPDPDRTHCHPNRARLRSCPINHGLGGFRV